MSVNVVMLLTTGVMYAGGVYLLLERTLTRVLFGMILIMNATNLLILVMAGAPGQAPLVEDGVSPSDYTDPLPQAMILTSIVISFAVIAFMVGMIYRSWKVGRRDEVLVDTEDVKVAERPAFDAEEDAELQEEHSEFLTEHEDPNADYEHATAVDPSAVSPAVRQRGQGSVRVATTRQRRDRGTGSGTTPSSGAGGERGSSAVAEPEEGEQPVGSRGHDDHLPDEDERAGSPRSRPDDGPETGADDGPRNGGQR
ncbi:Na(+)/H(+) antiporter subunit C [Citricoccus sp. GCM10030269]|uniref:Na(+)/H(+) antiporter subunit C n=1 Tax=Citricoccus sp. GCM10030269 TaxID=3273388 RepID=UPI00360C65BE